MEENKERKKGIARLIEVSGSKKKHLIAAGFFCALGSIAKMMIYTFVYLVLREIVKSGGVIAGLQGDNIKIIAIGAAVSLILSLLLEGVGSIFSHIAAFNLLYELRMKISKKLPKLSLGYFNNHATGEIKKVMSEDVERIEHFVAHNIVDFVSGIVTPIVTLIFLFIVDWRMALAVLISIPVAGAVGMSLFGSKKSMELSDKYQLAMGKMSGSAVEYINGMSVIKTFAKGKDIYDNLNKNIEKSGEAAIVWAEGLKTPFILFQTLLPATILFVFPIAVLLITNTNQYEVLLTSVLIFFVVGTNISEPMKQLMLLSGIFRKVAFAMESIDDILDAEELTEGNDKTKIKDSSIEFEHVDFSYDDNEIIKDISFKCEQGSFTALVGPSGAGKSTVAKLIARFWDVKNGAVKIGGRNIKEYANEKLMENISFVFQDVIMLSDTIEENIRMGNKEATKEDVINAAKAARIHEFINMLPNGYGTKIGEEGIYLSGGEQQRISIARAFLKNTPIIVLDEATAYADAESEAMIQKAFNTLAQDKTVIVVAHRLSTIVGANQILVLDKGQIKERGTHEQLLNLNGIYNNMWQIMTEGTEWKLQKGGKNNVQKL